MAVVLPPVDDRRLLGHIGCELDLQPGKTMWNSITIRSSDAETEVYCSDFARWSWIVAAFAGIPLFLLIATAFGMKPTVLHVVILGAPLLAGLPQVLANRYRLRIGPEQVQLLVDDFWYHPVASEQIARSTITSVRIVGECERAQIWVEGGGRLLRFATGSQERLS